jgi:hypothetical protein
VAEAGIHLLLIGSDIRAPVGQEWLAARRAGRWPALYRKDGILRTPAAESFIRFVKAQAAWQGFRCPEDLRRDALLLLAHHIVHRAWYYALSPAELDRLKDWRDQLARRLPDSVDPTSGGAGQSGVVLSPERYIPSDGVLIGSRPDSPALQATDGLANRGSLEEPPGDAQDSG